MNNTGAQCAAQLVEQQPGCWLVKGDINFSSVLGLREAGFSAIRQAPDRCRFDFSAVAVVNSMALSLILCWHRSATQAGIELQFSHLPAELIAIAGLCDLESLIATLA